MVVEHAWTEDEAGAPMVGVWLLETDPSADVHVRALRRTGARLDPLPRGRRSQSLQVGVDGELLGQTGFEIVDELDQYL